MASSMLVILLLLGLNIAAVDVRMLRVVTQWSFVDFNFPSEIHRNDAILRRQFIPGNTVPIDVDVHYKALGPSRVFVTFPRFRDGIPITLGTTSKKKSTDGSFLIDPYPDYNWHLNPTQDCANKMISVFRIAIDECERLWVIDAGKIGLASSPQVCPPKILVFDLNTNRMIYRYQIPRNQYNENTLFINPIIDVQDPPPGSCTHSKAYIADVAGFSMLVYDASTDSSWRITNKLMYPYPTFGTHTISGESFELMDGIFGMALMKSRNVNVNNDNRLLFFHALAADSENSVPVNLLNNRTVWMSDENAKPSAFKIVGPKGGQSGASAMDANGNLFFGLHSKNAIACWNIQKPLIGSNVKIIVKNDETLQFTAGMKVKRNFDGIEEIWVLTNRFQKVITGTLRSNEINFIIQAKKLPELLDGAQCT